MRSSWTPSSSTCRKGTPRPTSNTPIATPAIHRCHRDPSRPRRSQEAGGRHWQPAQAGSVLLGQLAAIQSVKAWLEPVKFLGIALLLTGISLALATIRRILQFQAGRILDLVSGAGR